MWRYTKDLICDWVGIVLQAFGPHLFMVGLVVALVAKSPWIYVPIFCVMFLFPSIFFGHEALSSSSQQKRVSVVLPVSIQRRASVVFSVLFFLGFVVSLVLKGRV